MAEVSKSPKPSIERAARRFPDGKAHLIFWSIALIGLAADLWTKDAVFEWLSAKPWTEVIVNGRAEYIPPKVVVIKGLFNIVMRENDGAAFSMFSGQRFALTAISLIAVGVVIGIFLFGRIRSRLMQVALGLFLAGIVGNLYDRLFNEGLVRDFLDFYVGDWHWPAFNVADSMLCTAVGLLLIANFTSAASEKPARPQKEEHPGPTPGQSHPMDENPQ